MEYLLLLIGFVLLIKGADFFVEGSSSLARFLKIPSVIIGLTIVAMGTSAPEASVSINAALAGNNDIAVSNVIGSNIFNGLVVVGICAFMAGFKTNRDILKRDMPVNMCYDRRRQTQQTGRNPASCRNDFLHCKYDSLCFKNKKQLSGRKEHAFV